MKKLLGLGFILVLFSSILTACGGSNNNELVGVWELNELAMVTELAFNADGTGIELVILESPEVEAEFIFEWSVEGDIITIDFDSDWHQEDIYPWIFPFRQRRSQPWIEQWSYSIDDDTLTITEEDSSERIFGRRD